MGYWVALALASGCATAPEVARTHAVPGGLVSYFGAVTPAIEAWVIRSADAVAEYYGRFPLRRATIFLIADGARGRGVYHGVTRGDEVRVSFDGKVDAQTLRGDWILIHELLHLGFPNVPAAQTWLDEGLSTYLEPVIRARIGLTTELELWTELHENLPRGVKDGALNESGSWASTYWGGAGFYLLADVLTREATHGERTLDDAIRGIVNAGGTILVDWDPAQLIAAADRATGVPVWAKLWREMGDSYAPTLTIEAALSKLGVRKERGRVVLDDRAPWASTRRSISAMNRSR